MGTRVNRHTKFEFDSEGDDEEEDYEKALRKALRKRVIELSSSDDEDEANEDLSLRIVEKAKMSRSGMADQNGLGLDKPEDVGDGVLSGDVIDISSCSTSEVELVRDPAGVGGEKKIGKKKREKRIKGTIETKENTADAVEEDKKAEVVGTIESVKLEESVQIPENIVLRKLLRGPRYFDPPDSGWGSCYNCGEEGHLAAKCTLAKRKKPCFICGSLEHSAKTCPEGQDCFICKKGGHHAKDCPDKYKTSSRSLKICLRCGDSGHEMFLCRNNYSADDLKEMQCYICKSFGHLCCGKFGDDVPKEVSCYKCGQLGHTGPACARSGGETLDAGCLSSCYKCGEEGHFARECMKACTRSGMATPGAGSHNYCYKCGVEGHFAHECVNAYARSGGETPGGGSLGFCYKCGEYGHFARECVKARTRLGVETLGAGSLNYCYKCGVEGHFARECMNAFARSGSLGSCHECGEGGHFARECTTVRKRSHELSTPSWKSSGKANDYMGFRSVPSNLGRAMTKKRLKYEEKAISASHKSKHRGGWITEDPVESPSLVKRRRSLVTPAQKRRNVFSETGPDPGHFSNSRSSNNSSNRGFGTPNSHGLAKSGKHRYSAMRFGNSNSAGTRRNHDRW